VRLNRVVRHGPRAAMNHQNWISWQKCSPESEDVTG